MHPAYLGAGWGGGCTVDILYGFVVWPLRANASEGRLIFVTTAGATMEAIQRVAWGLFLSLRFSRHLAVEWTWRFRGEGGHIPQYVESCNTVSLRVVT